MNLKKYIMTITILVLLSLTGCSVKYDSLKNKETGKTEIIHAEPSVVMTTAYKSISSEFPFASINELKGYQSGFSWYVQPFLDRTSFRFLATSVTGTLKDGTNLDGTTVSITTSGTQGFVESRYVEPLVKKFNSDLAERGINKVEVEKLVFNKGKTSSGKTLASSGSGFLVSNNGYILTNAHVVDGKKDITVYYKEIEVKAKVISSDTFNDIALLKIESDTTYLPIKTNSKIKIGSDISVVGYPNISIQGSEKKATFGYVNANSGIGGDKRVMQISAPIQPGNSGSPLLDEYGNVIGIVSSSLNQSAVLKRTGTLAQNVNYAIKMSYAIPLLIDSDVKYSNQIKSEKLSKVELIERTIDSIVLVKAK